MKPAPRILTPVLIVLVGVVAVSAAWYGLTLSNPAEASFVSGFDGQRAWQDVEYQVSLGPRLPGSQAHAQAVAWMVSELEAAGWEAEVQETTGMGHPIRNVIGRKGEGRPWVVIGAHYDSRLVADQDPDPDQRDQPVPGANDGASGVAVLLELARFLGDSGPAERSWFAGRNSAPNRWDEIWPGEVWLVFFDAEDNGNIPGWDWILGSRAFVEELDAHPDTAVIIDMIGDADLNVYWEGNSDPTLLQEIWSIAASLGYEDQFIPEYRYNILDDHILFVDAGIQAVDLIDFDYPYWHTVEDTPDKVTPESLQAVGETLIAWLTAER